MDYQEGPLQAIEASRSDRGAYLIDLLSLAVMVSIITRLL